MDDAVNLVPQLIKLVLVAAHADPVALRARLVPLVLDGAVHFRLEHIHQVEDDTGHCRHQQSVPLDVRLLLNLWIYFIHPHGDETIEGQPHDDVGSERLTHPDHRPAEVREVESLAIGGESTPRDGGDDRDVEDTHQQV